MVKKKHLLRIMACGTAALAVFSVHLQASAEPVKKSSKKVFTCFDKNGNILFTDSPSSVTSQCTGKVKTVQLPELGYVSSKSVSHQKTNPVETTLENLKKILQRELYQKRAQEGSLKEGEKSISDIFDTSGSNFLLKLGKISELLDRHPAAKKRILELIRRFLPPEAENSPFYRELFKSNEQMPFQRDH